MTGADHDSRLKRLRYVAWRRGFREADLIVGPFADRHLDRFDAAQLDEFERLLEVPDQDLYGWIIGRTATPAEFDGPVMELLRTFRFSAHEAAGPGGRGA